MSIYRYLEPVVHAVVYNDAHSATKFIDHNLVVRATRRLYGGRILRGRGISTDIVLTIGRPNHREREYIKQLKRAGEPFPVKKVWLKSIPVRRAA